MNAAETISLIGVVVGLGAFISGYLQYVKAQKWKRAEFVAKEIKEFEARPKVRLAMQMLDWNARTYDIGEPDEPNEVVISDSVLRDALRTHDEQSRFRPEEVFIRDVFDSFFDSLERFENFVESDLVSPGEFRPYLIYWLNIIGDKNNKRKPQDCRQAMWKYLDCYGYDGVIRFLGRYGHAITA